MKCILLLGPRINILFLLSIYFQICMKIGIHSCSVFVNVVNIYAEKP
jgi:hypothetical protein